MMSSIKFDEEYNNFSVTGASEVNHVNYNKFCQFILDHAKEKSEYILRKKGYKQSNTWDSDDIASEVTHIFLTSFDSGKGKPSSFLSRIVHNKILDKVRQTSRRCIPVSLHGTNRSGDVVLLHDVPDTHIVPPIIEDTGYVGQVVQTLSPPLKTTLNHITSGMTFKEAAETACIPIGTVKSRITTARIKICDALERKESGFIVNQRPYDADTVQNLIDITRTDNCTKGSRTR